MNSNDLSTAPLCKENLLLCQICKHNGILLKTFLYEPSNGMALFQPCKCNSYIHWRCWLRYWYNHQERYFRFCKLCGDFYNFDFDKKIDFKKECFICKEEYFMHSKRYPLQDTRWIKPCLCDKKVHHGCIISIYDLYKKCPDCHTKPVLKTYGSVLDMMRLYSCSTTLFAILLISGLGVYISSFLSISIRFYCSRYPKFRKRYANKVVIGNEQV